MTTPSILLSPPDFFEVTYAINPWMTPGDHVDVELAKTQWQNLKTAIEATGAEVKVAPPAKGLPDMVFTANAGIVNTLPSGKKVVVLASYKFEERQPEEPLMAAWFEANGYTVYKMPRTSTFEGMGDALAWTAPDGKVHVFSGYPIRTSESAHAFIAEHTGLTVHSIELVDPRYYHVDVCMCPTDLGDLIVYPPAFSDQGWAKIQSVVPADKLLVVNDTDANLFACNAVSVGKHIILNGSDKAKPVDIIGRLEAKGYTVTCVDMSEFLKSGGSCKCLTLRLG